MPIPKEASLNDFKGRGYMEVEGTNRGGRQGGGEFWLTKDGQQDVLRRLMSGTLTYTGVVYHEGKEFHHSLPVHVGWTDGERATLRAEGDPLAGHPDV